MADHGSYCPVSMATEVLADRWTPLIVRELLLGSTRFNDLVRALPGISRTLLSQRLRHLERRGVIEAWPSPTGRGSEYHLTPAGRDLEGVVDAFARWAIEWLYDELQTQEIPPRTLMWWMHRRVDPARFPPGRTVLEFRFTRPAQTIWLVLERDAVSVCIQHPGGDVDLVATGTATTFGQVFQGRRRWDKAVASGDIDVAGPPRMVRALPTWFTWSPWAGFTEERSTRAPQVSAVWPQPEQAV
jgi:DNA-binding HxlR family transcriptional regulator